MCSALVLLLVAARCCMPAVLLQPAFSRARALPQWARLVQQRCLVEGFFAGCDAFSWNRAPALALLTPEAGSPSGAFGPLLCGQVPATAQAVASCFGGLLAASPAPQPRPGLEAVLLNDIMVSHAWSTDSSWSWRDRSHINVLEGRAYLRALRLRAAGADDLRFVHGLDSNVVLGAVLKGRTSSYRLRPIVMKAAALQVALDFILRRSSARPG